jgi:hypothetical protein
MRKDHFTEEALRNAQALAELKYSENPEDQLAFAEAYDFARCQRPDGSFYGTAGQCRKGSPAGAKKKEQKSLKTPVKAKSSGSASNGETAKLQAARDEMSKKLLAMYDKDNRLIGSKDKLNKLSQALKTIDAKLKDDILRKQNLPKAKPTSQKTSGKEKLDEMRRSRAQSEHNSIKKLIEKGFSDRDSGGREGIMDSLGLSDRELTSLLVSRGKDDEDVYYLSNSKFEKLALGLSQQRLESRPNYEAVLDEVFGDNFSEEARDALDFARCQRPDGSFYGTAGQCRKGSPASAKQEESKPKKKLDKGEREGKATEALKDIETGAKIRRERDAAIEKLQGRQMRLRKAYAKANQDTAAAIRAEDPARAEKAKARVEKLGEALDSVNDMVRKYTGNRGNTGGRTPSKVETKAKTPKRRPEEDVRRKDGRLIGTSPRNMRIDARNELVKERDDYRKKFGGSSDEMVKKVLAMYEKRIELADKWIDKADQ